MQRRLLSLFFSKLSLTIFGCLISLSVEAQVIPDGTTSTTVNQDGNNFTIEQGDRVGDHLFHSFNEFSVPTSGSAAFNNAGDIANIFSRVTGSSISNIDGLISANGAANLFLINPNGIIFGENASLNLGGSFFASTADSLLFEGDTEFSASNPQAPPLLEVSIPIGLNFRDNPGDIAVNGSLIEVPTGESLSLLGGNVNITGAENSGIFAFGGRIELGGLTQAGEVGITTAGDVINSLSFPEAVAKGDVSLSNFAFVSVAGSNGGDIAVNARNINLEAGELGVSEISAGIVESGVDNAQAGDIKLNATDNVNIQGGSSIFNQVLEGTSGNSGNVEINTGTLNLDRGVIAANLLGTGSTGKIIFNARDRITITNISELSNQVATTGVGNVGGIEINTNSTVSIIQQSALSTNTAGQGNAGNLAIAARESVLVDDGSDLTSETLETASGDGGNITLDTANLTLKGGSFLVTATSGIGNAGNIVINSTNINLTELASLTTQTFGESQGNAGSISINTATLDLRDGAGIFASTLGSGNAQDINIQASDSILLNDGVIESSVVSTEIISVIKGEAVSIPIIGSGDSGNIAIVTGNLALVDGGQILTSTSGFGNAGNLKIDATESISLSGRRAGFDESPSAIASLVSTDIATGNAGSIEINTPTLNISDEARITAATLGEGNASDIIINAEELISLDNGGIFSTVEDTGIGNGGNIRITTEDLNVNNQGEINASSSGQGNGGNIFVLGEAIALNQGEISAANIPIEAITTEETPRVGGNINLETDIFTLQNNSQVSAQAGSNASGGNVDIDTALSIAFPNRNNDIIANAVAGKGGNINIATEAIFGIEERPLNPFTNDINASSEFGLQGDIAINTPDIDPTSGLIELPASVGDASDQISQNPCEQGVGSEFIVTGKGGLPPNVNESLNSESAQVGLIEAVTAQQQTVEGNNIHSNPSTTSEAVPAQGWIFNDNGEVTLTAYSTSGNKTQRSEQQHSNTCSSGIAP
jgi:filamentous hemagglutinin family protein